LPPGYPLKVQQRHFFAGSGTTGHSVFAQNASDGGKRKLILVQFPEKLEYDNKDQKQAIEFCDKLGKPRTIAELTKERLRRAGAKIKEENPMFSGDIGFRVFKLDSTNIREWDPNRDNLAESLEASVDHLKSNRAEQDILFELLLKLGLDLCVPMEQRTIAGKTVHSIGAGVLITCLDKSISRADAEPLALGILAWLKELNTAGDSTLVFRDSAFADDVAKTNLSKILEQNGIASKNIRSL
jgi:adenine-specific DNA-methyltransferase